MCRRNFHIFFFSSGCVLFGLASCANQPSEGSTDSPAAATPLVTTDAAVAKFAAFKSKAEAWASVIQKDTALDNATREKGRSLYISASASINGWITEYKWELAQNTGHPTSAAFNEALSQAMEDGQKYVDFVDHVYSKNAVSGTSVTLIGDAFDLIKSLVTTFAARGAAERKALASILDSLQWKSWDAIASGKPS